MPFDNVTAEEAVERIAEMIRSGRPHYVATANVDFVVKALQDFELMRILMDAHMVLCDGMPLVWASRLLGNPLPERVAGSDLVPRLLARAEREKWRVYFLGTTPARLEQAAANVRTQHPGLRVAGAYSPPFQSLLEMDHADILRRVETAKPDLLLVAFGCPKQEKWINMHYRKLGVPVSMGVGATLDFLAGAVRRAPQWVQRLGMEWFYRFLQEPGRLGPRYLADIWVFTRAFFRQWRRMRARRRMKAATEGVKPRLLVAASGAKLVEAPAVLDASIGPERAGEWKRLVFENDVILDLSKTEYIDSTGIGVLIQVQRQARAADRLLVLLAPSPFVSRNLSMMRLDKFFHIAPNLTAAEQWVRQRAGRSAPAVEEAGEDKAVWWEGEVTALHIDELREQMSKVLDNREPGDMVIVDLSRVSFIDSSGLGLMISLKKRALSQGVTLAFRNPTEAVANVLKIAALDMYLLGEKLE